MAEGLDPTQWNGLFQIIQVPGAAVADLVSYLAQGQGIRRLYSLDLTQFPIASAPTSASQGAAKLGGTVQTPATTPTSSTVTTDQPTLIAAITPKVGFAPYVPPTITNAPVGVS